MIEIKFQFMFDNFEVRYKTLDELLRSSFAEEEMCEELNTVSGLDEDFIEFKIIAKRQYTGIKDKNGVEIYEGDIVEVRGSKRIGTYITSVVHKGQCFKLKENKTLLNDDMSLISVKIIGNIYKNKDLLK